MFVKKCKKTSVFFYLGWHKLSQKHSNGKSSRTLERNTIQLVSKRTLKGPNI